MRRRFVTASLALAMLVPACSVRADQLPACSNAEHLFTLVAQSVPSATLLPCIVDLPVGWSFAGTEIDSGRFTFWLSSTLTGIRSVEVILTASCHVGDAVEVIPSADEAGTRRFEDPIALPPSFQADRYYTFAGGCVTYRYRFKTGALATLALQADQALTFRPRQPLVDALANRGLTLCGAGAPPCPGGE